MGSETLISTCNILFDESCIQVIKNYTQNKIYLFLFVSLSQNDVLGSWIH